MGEYYLEINHVLLGQKGVKKKDIKKVYSHHQALMQTSIFLDKNNIESVNFGDTAGGAKYISSNQEFEIGAIGSEILADIYALDILVRKINNEKKIQLNFY